MRKLTPERLADIKADIEDRRSVEYVLGDDVDELADIIHDLDLADQEIAKLRKVVEAARGIQDHGYYCENKRGEDGCDCGYDKLQQTLKGLDHV